LEIFGAGHLLSLVITLEFLGKEPIRASKWYGRAIQSYFLFALGDAASEKLANDVHDGNERRPYTVSTLSGILPSHKGRLIPGRPYFIHFTALTDQVISGLYKATQPGALMGVGTEITLDHHPFLIRDMTIDRQPGMEDAYFTSYKVIWDHFHQAGLELSGPVKLQIKSPAFFNMIDFTRLMILKDPTGKPYSFWMNIDENSEPLISHLPLPVLFFGGLVEKWNLFAPPENVIGQELIEGIKTNVFPQSVALKSRAVQIFGDNTHHIGCKGTIEYNAGEKADPEIKRIMRILAAYALFAGVGKGTTMGFGQCLHLK